jgi:excisionase family DNA binding protein
MYLTVTLAATKMGITRQYMHRLINQGKISTTVLAGRRVVIADSIFKKMQSERRKLPK